MSIHDMEYMKYSPYSTSRKLINLLLSEYKEWEKVGEKDKKEIIDMVSEDIRFNGILSERIRNGMTTRKIVGYYVNP